MIGLQESSAPIGGCWLTTFSKLEIKKNLGNTPKSIIEQKCTGKSVTPRRSFAKQVWVNQKCVEASYSTLWRERKRGEERRVPRSTTISPNVFRSSVPQIVTTSLALIFPNSNNQSTIQTKNQNNWSHSSSWVMHPRYFTVFYVDFAQDKEWFLVH